MDHKQDIKQLPERDALQEKDTWDLTAIFKTDEDFDKAFADLSEKLKKTPEYQGKMKKSSQDFLRSIKFVLQIYRELEKLYVYAHLKNDQDTANSKYQAIYGRAGALFASAGETMAWFEPEILSLSDDEIEAYLSENEELSCYRHFITTITKKREHILPEEMEALLAGAGEVLGAAGDIFSVLNNADIVFPVIEDEKGQKIQLSHGLYGQLLESTHRNVREDAFKGIYSVYKQFRNTFASTLSTAVKNHNYQAKVRHYKSAREAALSANHIPEAAYDTLLDVVKKNLPLLHRYVKLRKKLLKLDELHMYDLYTPLLGEPPIRFSYEEAKEQALCALKPLGEEYLAVVKEAFSSRWIDVLENQGKRSGAYSSGCYDTPPFILLNWHDSLDQLFTLVHEMGHSAHSFFTRKNQPYAYGDYSIFLAEIASTTNENILTEYLLQTQTDPAIRAYILNHYLDGFKGTIFRQTQFAEFEHFIHTQDAEGIPLTAEHLSDFYEKLNTEYYGKDVVCDPEIAYEWSRIPHFYYNYYVYQYATGFSAASALAGRIVKEEPKALENYLSYLKAGSSDYPIEVMKKAGVDMTGADYLTDAMKQFELRLDELEKMG